MATLIMCNHTIASTITFSWWSAYLTGGEVIYYKDWPTKNSQLEKTVVKKEYFPSSWIGMA